MYVTKEQFKTYFNITASTWDNLIDEILKALEQYINNYCGRNFTYDDYVDTINVPYRETLDVINKPIDSVTKIEMDGVEIESEYYYVDSYGMIVTDNGYFKGKVVITYKGGYSTIPEDITMTIRHVAFKIWDAKEKGKLVIDQTVSAQGESIRVDKFFNKDDYKILNHYRNE